MNQSHKHPVSILRRGNVSLQSVLLLGLVGAAIAGTHEFWDDGNGNGIRGGTVAGLEKHFDPTAVGSTGNHGPSEIPLSSRVHSGASSSGGGSGSGGHGNNGNEPPITETPWPDREHEGEFPDRPTCGNNTNGVTENETVPGPGKDPNPPKLGPLIVLHGDADWKHGNYGAGAEGLARSRNGVNVTIKQLPELNSTNEVIISAAGIEDEDGDGHPEILFKFGKEPNVETIRMEPAELADYLKKQGFSGKLVHLAVCDAGLSVDGNPSFQEELSAILGENVTVRGYPHLIRVQSSTGKIYKREVDFMGFDYLSEPVVIDLPKE